MRGEFVNWPAVSDLPVYVGCARPILRPLATAERVHRETAQDRLLLPDPTMALKPQHGVDFLVETLCASEAGTITLCALGPLTNIAMALVKAPEVAGKIGELVVMGGACFELGNVTPAAEFNMHVDPHAAAIVFDSGIPITMIPLDVTHQLVSTHRGLRGSARTRQPLRRGGCRAADFVREKPSRPNSARAPGRSTIRPSSRTCCVRTCIGVARSMSRLRRRAR